MFQRLKGAIDSRIAEEQARQRQAQLSAQGRQPQRRRPQNATPAARSSAGGAGEELSTDKGPDPKEFEPEVVAGDADNKAADLNDGSSSSLKTDGQGGEKDESTTAQTDGRAGSDGPSGKASSEQPSSIADVLDTEKTPELPTEVRVKLRKLERLESKYGELLKAYRVAHARVQIIEPFEASLRENTPLTSIADPTALVEYLNQTKLKGDMVLDELKRVTTEKDDIKKQFEQSRKDNQEMKTQLEDLTQKLDKASAESAPTTDGSKPSSPPSKVKSPVASAQDETKSENKARLSSFSLFSPKLDDKTKVSHETSEDLFSYDSEVPKLEAELEDKTAQVEQLNQQVVSLRNDLKVTRESTEGMVQTLEERTNEVNSLRESGNAVKIENGNLEKRIVELEASVATAQEQVGDLQKKLASATDDENHEHANSEELKKAQESWILEEKELMSKLAASQAELDKVSDQLLEKEKTVKDLENSLSKIKAENGEQSKQDQSSEKKLKVMKGIVDDMRTQINSSQTTIADLKKELESQQKEFESRPSSKVFALIDQGQIGTKHENVTTREDAVRYLSEVFGIEPKHAEVPNKSSQVLPAEANKEPTTGGNKKKNKKKKKGGAASRVDEETADTEGPVKVSKDLSAVLDERLKISSATPTITALQNEIATLKKEVEDKTASIDRLSKQLKDQDGLQEEIETLRDDLLHQGEEHVEARDALKRAQQERSDAQASVERLEQEILVARKEISSTGESQNAHKELSSQFEQLKSKLTVMEKDLKAAEQLAAARFKDIGDLKELLSKAQPELRSLRTEVAELKSAKEDLKNKQGEITRLESKHEDLKSEMKSLSRRFGDKDNEIKTLQQKIEQEIKARSKVEDELTSTQSDLRVAENKRKEARERADQTSKDFSKAKEDASLLRAKLRDLEDQLSNHLREIGNLKEDVSLKGALHASSQSLVQSLRDQTHELSTQAREALSRTENLEEELTEAQRMLSERTREGQTMRTLLNQTEGETETKIREMRERMEVAIEERDRVEDEANFSSRRMMREVEDAKTKAREAQRQLKVIEDERDQLENKSRSWQRMRDGLEQAVESAKLEVEDVRTAMKGLREALDESERQIKEAEIHKQDLRKQSDDANERIEKLTKANKSLSEEIKALQSGVARKANLRSAAGVDSGLQSSRTSTDSGGARSPAPINRNNSRSGTPLSTGTATGPNVGLSQAPVDYVYLKNVLLQFLERKDKAHQRQLIPVLGMLLHFNGDEEQKFISAISAK